MTTPVFVGVQVTNDTRLENAQVAFKDACSWTIIGRGWRFSGSDNFARMPEVRCPIVDLTQIIGEDDLIQATIQRYMLSNVGFQNVEGLLTDLQYLGATVSYSDCKQD